MKTSLYACLMRLVPSWTACSFCDRKLAVTNIFIAPGTYSLQIDAGQEVRYSATVEDCVGTNQNNGQNRSARGQPNPKNNVIRKTVPKKRLPPTGGLPAYSLVTGSVLAGACLLGLGIAVRRGPRD